MEVNVNLDNWLLGDYIDYIDAAKSLDFKVLLNMLSLVITSWSLKGDPKDVKFYRTLTIATWQELIIQVNKSLSDKFNPKN